MSALYTEIQSPIGTLLLTGDSDRLTGLYMQDPRHAAPRKTGWQRDDTVFESARKQLAAYFAGERQTFDLPLAPIGTDFQQRVWQALREIPYGETESYASLATRIGNANASRAVGLANGRNPISIIVPCHRVIGADGSLTGYGGGIDRKRWLLAHEGCGVDSCASVQPELL